MAKQPLTKTEFTALASASDKQEALCRSLAASTRLPIYTTFANKHATKAARKRTLASRAPLVLGGAIVNIEISTKS